MWCSDSPGRGGSEISMMRVLDFLKEEHHRFSALLRPDVNAHLLQYFTTNQIPVQFFYAPSDSKGIIHALVRAIRLRRQHRGCIFIFWSHHADSCRWLKLWIVLLGGRVVIAERSVAVSKANFTQSRLSIPIKKIVNPLAKCIILNAQTVLKPYIQLFGKATVKVIRNSRDIPALQQKIDEYRKHPEQRDAFMKPGVCNLLLVARLSLAKGIHTVIEAIGILKKEGMPLIHLHLVGEGEYRTELEELAAAHAPGQIHFYGFRDDVCPWLAFADMFVFPSLLEGMPGALLEAMVAGLPCVVSDIEANMELVTGGETGFVFAAGDARAMAERIRYAIEHPAEAQRLAKTAAIKVAGLFDAKQEKEAWINLLHNLSE